MPAPGDWLPFEVARAFARKLGLTSVKEWDELYADSGKRPANIPSRPDRSYHNRVDIVAGLARV